MFGKIRKGREGRRDKCIFFMDKKKSRYREGKRESETDRQREPCEESDIVKERKKEIERELKH